MNNMNQVEQGSTFHPFSKLPAELRLKIWALSLTGPRVVSIRCGATSLSFGSQTDPASSNGCTSPAPIPANLHACHESRAEALRRRYRFFFGIARQPGQILFDPEQDVLFFGPRDGYMASEAQFRTVLSLVDPDELAQIRCVAVSEALFSLFWADVSSRRSVHSARNNKYYQSTSVAASLTVEVLRQIRGRLPNVRELIFVPRDEAPLPSVEESAVVQSRMQKQIQAAMRVVCEEFPAWTSPSWKVLPPGAGLEPPVYCRSGRQKTKLDAMQESVRLRFKEMAAH